jgi:hypothetical protein
VRKSLSWSASAQAGNTIRKSNTNFMEGLRIDYVKNITERLAARHTNTPKQGVG